VRGIRRRSVLALGALLVAPFSVFAQQDRLFRIGVIFPGGLYNAVVDGLRDGLKAEGLAEGKQFVFHIRDIKGDLNTVAATAKSLEAEKVDLICSVTTSSTVRVKQATKIVPVVFYAGNDPVAMGLVEQFRRPGGRLTGVYSRNTDDLIAKRFELLAQLAPKTRRIVAFYNPENPISRRSLAIARAALTQLKLEIVEHHVRSVDEFRGALGAFRPSEGDAIGYLIDSIVVSQSDFVAETGMAKRMPTIFADASVVAKGGLASYGESYYKVGRHMARHVRRVMLGANPGVLPVEQLDEMHFAVNLKTAKALGLSIPRSLLLRADEVIQ